MGLLEGKTLFITGASRGIGKAIAIRAAKEGANVAIVAKTSEQHPKLPGTIHLTAEIVESVGGKALPIMCDIRFEDQIIAAVQKTVEKFGGIDVVINNASAISLTSTLDTDVKKFDLMHQINVRGTFLVSKHCIPYLRKSTNPHILMMSPPLSMKSKWFAPHLAYAMSKYGMSMCVLGLSEELCSDNIAVNALWPKTIISTAALQAISSESSSLSAAGRSPEIMADATLMIITQPSDKLTFRGNFFIDEDVLRSSGMVDFDHYSTSGNKDLMPDFFLEDDYVSTNLKLLQKSPEECSNYVISNSKITIPGFKCSEAFQELNIAYGIMSEPHKKKLIFDTNAIYGLDIKNDSSKIQTWTIDLKRQPGGIYLGLPALDKPHVSLAMSDADFMEYYSGRLSGKAAFMQGKLKIRGDTILVNKLENAFKVLKSRILSKL